MNKILFLALAIAIAAVAGVMGLTVTQEVEAHCDGIGTRAGNSLTCNMPQILQYNPATN